MQACATDVTDGSGIRRRAKSWRWVLSVVVAGALLVGLVILVIRLDTDRSARAVAAAIVAALLAVAAVVITWLESRRITGHLNRTIDRLIEAESELRVLLDDLPEAVMSVDDHGIVRGANARAAELVGQPVDDLVGRRLDGFVESSRLDELTSWLAGGRRGEAVPPMSLRVLRAGAPTATLVEAIVDRPHRSAGAAIVRLRDITEREARGQALEQARQRFQQAFHSAPTGMALVRMHDSTIIDANRSLAEMLDRPIGQLVGRSIREFTHPDDLARRRGPRRPARARQQRQLPARSTLPAQRRRVRVGAHPRRADRGQRRGLGDHPHRGRHRAAPHRRAAAVGGHPRRPDRPPQPHRAAGPRRRHAGRRGRRSTSRCCSSTSTTSRSSTTASATASATRC